MPSITQLAQSHFLLGVTGHRDLLPEDFDFEVNSSRPLNVKIRKELQKIKSKSKNETLALLTCRAEGADQLVAWEARQLGIKVIGIVFSKKDQNNFSDIDEELPFYLDSLSAEDRKTKEYEIGASIISEYSNYLIAIWDGVDTGLEWGTSDIIYSMTRGKNSRGQHIQYKQKNGSGIIVHIPTKRQKNKFLFDSISSGEQSLNIKPTLAEQTREINFSSNLSQPRRKSFPNVSNLRGELFTLVVTALCILLTVCFGTYGFKLQRGFELWKGDSSQLGLKVAIDTVQKDRLQKKLPLISEEQVRNICIKKYDWDFRTAWSGNDFFNAVNLITFNSSVQNLERIHWSFKVARILGLFSVLLGFISAIFLAINNNRKVEILLKFRVGLQKILGFKKNTLSLVTGSSLPALDLAIDLKKQGHFIIMLAKNHDSAIAAEAKSYGIRLYEADPGSSTALEAVRSHYANYVFMLSDDDSENIRTCRELDQLCSEKETKFLHESNWYLLIKEQRLNDMVSTTKKSSKVKGIHVINLYENIARRLLVRYPIDSFDYPKQDSEIFVFGNTEVARQIVLTALKQGHFAEGHQLKITWFVYDHEQFQKDFLQRYPCFDQSSKVFKETHAKTIRDKVLPTDILFFKEMPVSDNEYFNEGRIDAAIKSNSIIRMYFCLDDSILSAAYLNAIAIKINPLQQEMAGLNPPLNIQMFCFYNLQDRKEVQHAQRICNRNIPHAPVIFFGNFLDECSFSALTEKSLDRLPTLINYWYEDGGKSNHWRNPTESTSVKDAAEKSWDLLNESHRESSRQAADHLWIKLRILDKHFKDRDYLKEPFKLQEKKYQKVIDQLARIEHYRWCRERILDGFIPLQDIEKFKDIPLATLVARWNEDKAFKKSVQHQKLHLDLVLYEELDFGTDTGTKYNEQTKDISFIEAIPLLYSLLIRLQEDAGNR